MNAVTIPLAYLLPPGRGQLRVPSLDGRGLGRVTLAQISKRLPLSLAILCLLTILNAAAASVSIADQTAANFLKQVREEPDPAKRIELLDLALKDSSLKGDALGSVFFERAMAYKAMNDCFRAIEDFDSSISPFA